MEAFKCNKNKASKGNPRPSSGDFCVKSDSGNMVFIESRKLGDKKIGWLNL